MDNAKNNQKKLKQLFALLDEMEAYARCIGKVSFDMECCAPEEGIAQAGEDMATIGRQFHKLMHSKKYVKLICELHEDSEGLTEVQKKAVEHKYDEYIKSKNESAKFAYEMNLASSKAYGEWLAAKKAADFSLYRDSMATLIDFTRRSIDLRDEKKPTYYDSLLDDYEKGNDHVQLDAFFGALKEHMSGGKLARTFDGTPEETALIATSDLLTLKKTIYAANLSEDDVAAPESVAYFSMSS